MPYFFLQHDDYLTLKERVCNHMVSGDRAEGVADIQVAIETLKVAEFVTQEGMNKYKPGFLRRVVAAVKGSPAAANKGSQGSLASMEEKKP
ncbi:unnamed protein product [Heterosigma akashiwo]